MSAYFLHIAPVARWKFTGSKFLSSYMRLNEDTEVVLIPVCSHVAWQVGCKCWTVAYITNSLINTFSGCHVVWKYMGIFDDFPWSIVMKFCCHGRSPAYSTPLMGVVSKKPNLMNPWLDNKRLNSQSLLWSYQVWYMLDRNMIVFWRHLTKTLRPYPQPSRCPDLVGSVHLR